MTKYLKHVNREWDYEDLVKEEILVFSVPDDFDFSILKMMKDAMEFLGHTKISVEKKDYGSMPYYVKSKHKGRWHELFSLAHLFEYDTQEIKKLFAWLEENYDVKLLTLEDA